MDRDSLSLLGAVAAPDAEEPPLRLLQGAQQRVESAALERTDAVPLQERYPCRIGRARELDAKVGQDGGLTAPRVLWQRAQELLASRVSPEVELRSVRVPQPSVQALLEPQVQLAREAQEASRQQEGGHVEALPVFSRQLLPQLPWLPFLLWFSLRRLLLPELVLESPREPLQRLRPGWNWSASFSQ